MQVGSVVLNSIGTPAGAASCRWVYFPRAFAGTNGSDVVVTVTTAHGCSGACLASREPISAWVGSVSAAGFIACLREFADQDGVHTDIVLNYVAARAGSDSVGGLATAWRRTGLSTVLSASVLSSCVAGFAFPILLASIAFPNAEIEVNGAAAAMVACIHADRGSVGARSPGPAASE